MMMEGDRAERKMGGERDGSKVDRWRCGVEVETVEKT